MDDKTVNGLEDSTPLEETSDKFMENNNQEEIGEKIVTYAEVTHEIQEPIAFKRNIISETKTENQDLNGDNLEEKEEEEVVTTDPISTEQQTSENFIKFEERNIIERLSRVIDTELTLETLRVDTEEVNENDSQPEVEESEQQNSEVIEVFENSEESTESKFQVTNSEETEEPVDEPAVNTDTSPVNEFRSEPIVDNTINEDEKPVIEDVIIKQNGRKTIYSSEDDIEEEDGLPEIIGFRSTLKMWSNGKSVETDVPQIDSKDKFKTLRQIKRGNTRSLMERFQNPSKS